ncbi:MAG: hypothetical protein PHI35_08845, partial [Victivallaceae bacterium]|nr:hypothetical protein [Victivallaceae bacterium]
NAFAVHLVVVSANPEITGDIVIAVGGQSFTVAVGATPAEVRLSLNTPFTGVPSVVRDTTAAGDKLRDGEPVTALVLDWVMRRL